MSKANQSGGVSPDQVREIALAMPSAAESPHFDRASFRVNNKIFATLDPKQGQCVLKLTLADQTALLEFDPKVFHEVGWSHQGWIGVSLEHVDHGMIKELIQSAWRNVAPKKLLAELAD